MRRHTLVTAAAALALAVTVLHAPADAKTKTPATTQVTFTGWDFGDGDPAGGAHAGTAVSGGALTMTSPTGTRSYDDPFDPAGAASYDQSSWTSPLVDPTFGITELVASWNAHTPGGSWVEVSVQGVADGVSSKSYVLGRWADHDTSTPAFHPTSLGGQADELATVSIDTLVALNEHTFDSYRVTVSLLRPVGSTAAPTVDMVGAMASNVPEVKKVVAPPTTMTEEEVLDVPTYSQEIHIGHYPEWDNGGEAWCSPTSTAMVLDYWERGPSAADYAWVLADDPDHVDPQVDHAARRTFDYNYDGAGNWPFNTAYAGSLGLESFVTRLRDLTEAERLIKAGIPVVTSVSFKKSALDGAGYGTNGHLMTIVGFTADGDVVVNDPASHLIPSNDEVRVTYDRQQFTEAWIGHTGGIAYVIHPESVPLPAANAEANW
jgi:hypothetical protein